MRRVLKFPDLRSKGIKSRMTLHRLRQDETFPRPIKLGGSIAWFEDELDAYLSACPRVEKSRTPATAGPKPAAGRNRS